MDVMAILVSICHFPPLLRQNMSHIALESRDLARHLHGSSGKSNTEAMLQE